MSEKSALDKDAARERLLAATVATWRLEALIADWPNREQDQSPTLREVHYDAAIEAARICMTLVSEELPNMLGVDMVNHGDDDYDQAYKVWQRRRSTGE